MNLKIDPSVLEGICECLEELADQARPVPQLKLSALDLTRRRTCELLATQVEHNPTLTRLDVSKSVLRPKQLLRLLEALAALTDEKDARLESVSVAHIHIGSSKYKYDKNLEAQLGE